MDYKLGFKVLKKCLAGADSNLQSELATLETRFWKNERNERVFGSSENTRNERSQIIFSLNDLALKHCGISFNELCQGAQPPEQPVPTKEPGSPSTPPTEHLVVPFKLQIRRIVGRELEVRALETPSGEPRATSRLPYNYPELVAVLKALRAASPDGAQLKPDQKEVLRDLGLLNESGLINNLQVRVGQDLYQALFPGDLNAAFQMAWNQARGQRGTVALQLRFDEDTVALARYPWELLYYRRHLLPSGGVELTRYISYSEASTTLSVAPPLRVLYVESRPTGLSELPDGKEQTTVGAALKALEDEGLVSLENLSPPTYDGLIDRIEGAQDHVLHFDGHGRVARRCPVCGGMNYPHHTTCQQADCGHSLEGVPPLGYLAFERGDGSRRVDWVDSNALGILYGSAMRLAVLSACHSGEVRGDTLFGGVGPALIQAGVPAVVAMQTPVKVRTATRFMRGFYGALARFESLPAAMTSGRRRLFRGQEWFIPALYLRSQDDEVQLFKST
jgi:DNA-binding transcriptional ArsR family regulator